MSSYEWNTETYRAALMLDGQPYEIKNSGDDLKDEDVARILKDEVIEDFDSVAAFVAKNCGGVMNDFMSLLWQHIENIDMAAIVSREVSD